MPTRPYFRIAVPVLLVLVIIAGMALFAFVPRRIVLEIAGDVLAGYWRVIGAALFLVMAAAGGMVLCMLFVRHREARAAEEKERFYRGLVEASQEGLLVVDNRVIVWANEEAARIFGFEAASGMRGQPIRQFYSDETNERIEKTGYQVLLREGRYSEKYTMKTRAGGEIICNLSISLLEPKGGDVFPKVLVTVRDITREEALRDEVMRYVRMEALGRMAGGIAHNFNNILGGIMGYASLLQEFAASAELSRYAATIIDACRQGGELTERLLAFARGTKQPRTVVNPAKIVEEAERLVQHIVPANVVVQRRCSEGLPNVCVALGDIVQAIVNVIKNGIEAMPNGGLLVVECEKTAVTPEHSSRLLHLRPGEYIRFSITDTGIGIPVEHMDRIFEPFFSTKKQKTGTGLGLSMVYAAVREHGGETRVYSEPGSGTIFHIYLPTAEAAGTEEVAAKKGRGTPPFDSALFVGLKVLVLEDDQALMSFFEEVLSRKGAIVLAVPSVADFRATLASGFPPDVVVLDMMLPDGSGAVLAKELRQNAPQIRLVGVSGFSKNGQAKAIIDAGVDAFLQKPFNAGELLAAIYSVVAKSGEKPSGGDAAGQSAPASR